MSAWLFSARILLVVDRIEPPMAVLEWPSGELTDAPLTVLPPAVAEGDALLLRLGRSRHGALAAGEPTFLMTAEGLLSIPDQIQPGHRYTFRFQPPGQRARILKEHDSHAKKNNDHP